MEDEAESNDAEQAKNEDPGSSEAPVSGQPGGGLDGPDGPDGPNDGEVPEADDSPVGSPDIDEDR